MKPSIKLICTDFDGTVYHEYGNPPIHGALEELIDKLQQQGVIWVINTGRDLSSLMEELGRTKVRILPDYVVVVEREIYKKSGKAYKSHDAWNERCTLAHQELFDQISGDIPDLFAWVSQWFDATVYEDQYSPFCLIARHNEDADEIASHLEEYCEMIDDLTVVRNDVYARFSHAGFNKGTALEEIARLEGIRSEEIIAAGDHHNDLPMLSTNFASHLIAPANAIPKVREQVKEQGGWIASLEAGEGVYEGLTRLFSI